MVDRTQQITRPANLVLEKFEHIFKPTYDPYNMFKNFQDIVAI